MGLAKSDLPWVMFAAEQRFEHGAQAVLAQRSYLPMLAALGEGEKIDQRRFNSLVYLHWILQSLQKRSMPESPGV